MKDQVPAVVFAVLYLVAGSTAGADFLAEYRWSHRPLIVFPPDKGDGDVSAFAERLTQSACELRERDVVIVWGGGTASAPPGSRPLPPEAARSLRDALDVAVAQFGAFLVGKDGGVKARYGSPPALEDIFGLIDGMPMRRAEARLRESRCPV